MIDDLALGSLGSSGDAGRGERAADLVDLLMRFDAGALPDLAVGESRFGPDERQYPFTVGHRGSPVASATRSRMASMRTRMYAIASSSGIPAEVPVSPLLEEETRPQLDQITWEHANLTPPHGESHWPNPLCGYQGHRIH